MAPKVTDLKLLVKEGPVLSPSEQVTLGTFEATFDQDMFISSNMLCAEWNRQSFDPKSCSVPPVRPCCSSCGGKVVDGTGGMQMRSTYPKINQIDQICEHRLLVSEPIHHWEVF